MKNATRYAVAFAESSSTTAGSTDKIPLGLATPCEKPMAKDHRARACVAARSRSVRVPVPVPAAHETSASTETDDHPRSTSVSSASRGGSDTSSLAWSPWFFPSLAVGKGVKTPDVSATPCVCGRSRSCARACAVLPGRIASGEAGGDRAFVLSISSSAPSRSRRASRSSRLPSACGWRSAAAC